MNDFDIDLMIKEYNGYLIYVLDLASKDKLSALKFVMTHYLAQFERIFDVYDVELDVDVYYNSNFTAVKLFLNFDECEHRGGIFYRQSNKVTEINNEKYANKFYSFTGDSIIIFKPFNTINFTFIQGIHDCAIVMEDIEKAEIELI